MGQLPKLNRITSVSGGSITSALLAMNWANLEFDETTGIARNFKSVMADPLQKFCSMALDVKAGIGGILSWKKTIGNKVAELYAKRLFGQTTLQDLPAGPNIPEFIFYATSLQTGVSVRMTKEFLADYTIGKWSNPVIPLSIVVAASSAFPPVLSPVIFEIAPEQWEKTENANLFDNIDLRKRLVLTDGGVYDNMGLEAVWNDDFKTVLVCDAGAPLGIEVAPGTNWMSQALRTLNIIAEQTRRLRRRTLINNYKELNEDGSHKHYGGTYWGIATEIDNYRLDDALVKDNAVTGQLKSIRTRLNAFSDEEQGHLINWGYALTDVALRRWVYPDGTYKPGKWPIPEYALDK
jgi:NTE family protein